MKRALVSCLLLFALSAHAAETLRVTSAGPAGEVASMAEANEIRVVFSEPMVVVGKIPQPVTAPFVRIEPAIGGTFRWSGTTTLIFTPGAKLPFATKYAVTIDKAARSVAGNTLDRTYSFSFNTPTIRLLSTEWYRKGGKFDAPVVIAMRFNQPVDPKAIVQYLQLRTVAHELQPVVAPDQPEALASHEAKLARAAKAASSNAEPVFAFLATEWDRERFPSANDLVVMETKPGVPPDTWIEVILDEKLAARATSVRTGRSQEFTIQLQPALFVSNISCREKCDPENGLFIEFRTMGGLFFKQVAAALTVVDVTDPAREVALKPQPRSEVYEYPSSGHSLDDLGYTLLPARNYRIRIAPTLEAADGQKLGYTWTAAIEFWHKAAFISFGDGQGVWESGGGEILPFHARNLTSVKQWLAPLALDRLMPTILNLQNNGFRTTPPSVKPQDRTLRVITDKTQSYGLDVSSALGADNLGLLWAAMEPGRTIAKTRLYDPSVRATLVQVTNLGLSVKDSPLNTLVMVTRLDDGKPVAAANVSIRTRDNKIFWSGVTDAKGIAIAPRTDLRQTAPPKPAAANADPNLMQGGIRGLLARPG